MAEQRLVLVERKDGKWGWELIGDNGYDIIATDGNQGYENQSEARAMAEKIIGGHYVGSTVTARRQKP